MSRSPDQTSSPQLELDTLLAAAFRPAPAVSSEFSQVIKEAAVAQALRLHNTAIARLFDNNQFEAAFQAFERDIASLGNFLLESDENQSTYDFHGLNLQTTFIAAVLILTRHVINDHRQKTLIFVVGSRPGPDQRSIGVVRGGAEAAADTLGFVVNEVEKNEGRFRVALNDETVAVLHRRIQEYQVKQLAIAVTETEWRASELKQIKDDIEVRWKNTANLFLLDLQRKHSAFQAMLKRREGFNDQQLNLLCRKIADTQQFALLQEAVFKLYGERELDFEMIAYHREQWLAKEAAKARINIIQQSVRARLFSIVFIASKNKQQSDQVEIQEQESTERTEIRRKWQSIIKQLEQDRQVLTCQHCLDDLSSVELPISLSLKYFLLRVEYCLLRVAMPIAGSLPVLQALLSPLIDQIFSFVLALFVSNPLEIIKSTDRAYHESSIDLAKFFLSIYCVLRLCFSVLQLARQTKLGDHNLYQRIVNSMPMFRMDVEYQAILGLYLIYPVMIRLSGLKKDDSSLSLRSLLFPQSLLPSAPNDYDDFLKLFNSLIIDIEIFFSFWTALAISAYACIRKLAQSAGFVTLASRFTNLIGVLGFAVYAYAVYSRTYTVAAIDEHQQKMQHIQRAINAGGISLARAVGVLDVVENEPFFAEAMKRGLFTAEKNRFIIGHFLLVLYLAFRTLLLPAQCVSLIRQSKSATGFFKGSFKLAGSRALQVTAFHLIHDYISAWAALNNTQVFGDGIAPEDLSYFRVLQMGAEGVSRDVFLIESRSLFLYFFVICNAYIIIKAYESMFAPPHPATPALPQPSK